MKAKSDFLFFGLLAILVASTVIQSQVFGYVLSLNNYLGFLFWTIALALRLGNFNWKRYTLGFLLLFGTLNVLNFGIGKISFVASVGGIETPGLNPVILLVLIVYYFVNRISIKRVLSNTFYDTQDEQKIEQQKKVDFYLQKFSSCNDLEFENALKNFNDYPTVAQIALTQIIEQKNNEL